VLNNKNLFQIEEFKFLLNLNDDFILIDFRILNTHLSFSLGLVLSFDVEVVRESSKNTSSSPVNSNITLFPLITGPWELELEFTDFCAPCFVSNSTNAVVF
jgi:hypothetical protein